MTNINWIQILIGFLGGGAIGALIKQFFDNKKNRIQPIAHSIELSSLYDSFANGVINSEVILKDTTGDYSFSRLYNGKLKIINTGSTDFSEFIFGLTINTDADFIHADVKTKDRHHVLEIVNNPGLSNQINAIDFKLKPFNRKDHYIFDFLITSELVNVSSKNIEISSPHPIKWISETQTSDLLLEITKQTLLKIGPLTLDFRK
jgi:hypothetical protein